MHFRTNRAQKVLYTERAYRLPVLVLLLYVLAVIIGGTGLALIIDDYRGRPHQAERLLPLQSSLADEAQAWLQQE